MMRAGKYKVYLNEFNVPMGNVAYFPLVSGLLRVYAETFKETHTKYEFMPFVFIRDTVGNIIAQYNDPSVAAFSVYMWNEQLSLKVAEELKGLYPDVLIVFGGPQVPHYPHQYFSRYPFIDVTIRGEGEGAFSELLKRYIYTKNFENISGIAWRDHITGDIVRNDAEQTLPQDLDIYPSPYMSGIFDDLMAAHKDIEFQAIIETNRGCPYMCAYCFWGQGGLSRKMRYHSLERVTAEITWLAEHKIRYVFNADSNFGIKKRDVEIAQILVEAKKKYGYPEKFRSCFTKNAEDRIYDIAMLLCKHELEKGITLSFQSVNTEVLENIKRHNIRLSTYKNLQVKFNHENVPVYTELILALPGETYRSWVEGINAILESGFMGQLFVYLCEIYPNTDMASPSYKERFGIVTKRITLTETHGSIRTGKLVSEYQDIIVSTTSMPLDDWRRSLIFSWVVMVLFSLKLCFFILTYLHKRYQVKFSDFVEYICSPDAVVDGASIIGEEIKEYNKHIDNILKGCGRSCTMAGFGSIYWDIEEASFLRISTKLGQFYNEMFACIKAFFRKHHICEPDNEELSEIIKYQYVRIPVIEKPLVSECAFNFNLPEYFESMRLSSAGTIKRKRQIVKLQYSDFHGDKVQYAKEVVLWGRKSNKIITPVEWCNA